MSILTVRQKLIDLLTQATSQAQQQGRLPQVAIPDITLERPQNPSHGDYATSLPLKLARACAMNPMDIARTLSEFLSPTPEVSAVTVAPPGFINFTCSQPWLSAQVDDILAAGEDCGRLNIGEGHSVQVEFVSANPTGPLHVGHGRGAVLGSTLANILGAAGYDVQTEYYTNDAGSQMQAFYQSLWARYQQELGLDATMPESGYFGRYMIDLAKEMAAEYGSRFVDSPNGITELGAIGIKKMLELKKKDLAALGVKYDCWFSEQSLYDSGEFQRVLDMLRRQGYLVEKEGATWFASTALAKTKTTWSSVPTARLPTSAPTSPTITTSLLTAALRWS